MAERLLRFSSERKKAEDLGGLDPDVVETAGLAHDLGHPPFGHVAEKALQKIGADELGLKDSFEGNAQSFRIVASLAIRDSDYAGLNLTRASLNAILKYPWVFNDAEKKTSRKWGAYFCDAEIFEWAREPLTRRLGFELGRRKTLEAAVMDFSDDIAYCVYDLEDFTKAGKIPLDRLFEGPTSKLSREAEKFLMKIAEDKKKDGDSDFDIQRYRKALMRLKKAVPVFPRYDGTNEHRAHFRDFTSTLVGRFMNSVSIRLPDGSLDVQLLAIPEDIEAEVELLKSLTFSYVVYDPSLANQQAGYKAVITCLVNDFHQAALHGELNRFPTWAREILEAIPAEGGSARRTRALMDFVASLTEAQALNLHQRITGVSAGNLFPSQF